MASSEGRIGKPLYVYRVFNEEHDIILHATDAEDALYCISEGWPDGIGEAYLAQVNDADYPDLQIGYMLDRKAQ